MYLVGKGNCLLLKKKRKFESKFCKFYNNYYYLLYF